MIIFAQSLTPQTFSPYGSVISSKDQPSSIKSTGANYGSAVKLYKVSPVENKYANAPSKKPSTANWNLFRCSPPKNLKIDENNYLTYNAPVLERHPFSTQTFLPLGRDKNSTGYLVIVAGTASDGNPDLNKIEAFVAAGDQAVTYGVATWHAPMVALKETLDFAVLVHENDVQNEDVQEVHYDPPLIVKFNYIDTPSSKL